MGILKKVIWEFCVLFLQLFCDSEIISKQKVKDRKSHFLKKLATSANIDTYLHFSHHHYQNFSTCLPTLDFFFFSLLEKNLWNFFTCLTAQLYLINMFLIFCGEFFVAKAFSTYLISYMPKAEGVACVLMDVFPQKITSKVCIILTLVTCPFFHWLCYLCVSFSVSNVWFPYIMLFFCSLNDWWF